MYVTSNLTGHPRLPASDGDDKEPLARQQQGMLGAGPIIVEAACGDGTPTPGIRRLPSLLNCRIEGLPVPGVPLKGSTAALAAMSESLLPPDYPLLSSLKEQHLLLPGLFSQVGTLD